MSQRPLVTTPPLRVLQKTQKAIKFDQISKPDNEPFWIPKSQIEEPDDDELEVGTEQEITITAWIAGKVGLDE